MPTIITIAQTKGGSGKTTIAAHLASVYAHEGKKVTLIDLNEQGGLRHWYGLREKHAIGSIPLITLVTSTAWRLHTSLEALPRENDVVIIDSQSQQDVDINIAIRAADMVLIPVEPNPADKWSTERTVAMAAKEHVPYRIILNRAIPNSNLLKDMQSQFKQSLIKELTNRVAYAAAMSEGLTVNEALPDGDAAYEIRALAHNVGELVFPAVADKYPVQAMRS